MRLIGHSRYDCVRAVRHGHGNGVYRRECSAIKVSSRHKPKERPVSLPMAGRAFVGDVFALANLLSSIRRLCSPCRFHSVTTWQQSAQPFPCARLRTSHRYARATEMSQRAKRYAATWYLRHRDGRALRSRTDGYC